MTQTCRNFNHFKLVCEATVCWFLLLSVTWLISMNHWTMLLYVFLWLFSHFQAKAASALSQHDYSISRLKTCWDSLQTDRTAGSFLTLVTSSFPSAKVRIKGSGSDRGQCQNQSVRQGQLEVNVRIKVSGSDRGQCQVYVSVRERQGSLYYKHTSNMIDHR